MDAMTCEMESSSANPRNKEGDEPVVISPSEEPRTRDRRACMCRTEEPHPPRARRLRHPHTSTAQRLDRRSRTSAPRQLDPLPLVLLRIPIHPIRRNELRRCRGYRDSSPGTTTPPTSRTGEEQRGSGGVDIHDVHHCNAAVAASRNLGQIAATAPSASSSSHPPVSSSTRARHA